tara:strand:- start:3807 stop:3941 length:135 start_codon:yes stop_codon:yes gene_type:complete
MGTILYAPNGIDSIEVVEDQVEYLKTKGWASKPVNKKNKKNEEN